jgi:ABC-type branched-subunit amino acid transport system ATPase component
VPDELVLEVEDLTVKFGGAIAVEDLSLRAGTGAITALIGPNGAGKSTTFNAVTGLVKPTRGEVRLGGVSLAGLAPARRAQLGLGRTFQRMQLCDSLSVRRNVSLGLEARLAGRHVLRHLRGSRDDARRIRDAVDEAIDLTGLGALADRTVGALSTGQRRLVELARVTASGSRLLLLDEPSSGLDGAETQTFGSILTQLVERRDVGILLVEHDMELVMGVSSQLYVLDFGRLIFEGDPASAQASADVRAAYLGAAG